MNHTQPPSWQSWSKLDEDNWTVWLCVLMSCGGVEVLSHPSEQRKREITPSSLLIASQTNAEGKKAVGAEVEAEVLEM